MSEVNDWNKLNEDDRNLILTFVADNTASVKDMMRNKFPSLYIGKVTDQVARGWLMIAGLSEVKDFISGSKK